MAFSRHIGGRVREGAGPSPAAGGAAGSRRVRGPGGRYRIRDDGSGAVGVVGAGGGHLGRDGRDAAPAGHGRRAGQRVGRGRRPRPAESPSGLRRPGRLQLRAAPPHEPGKAGSGGPGRALAPARRPSRHRRHDVRPGCQPARPPDPAAEGGRAGRQGTGRVVADRQEPEPVRTGGRPGAPGDARILADGAAGGRVHGSGVPARHGRGRDRPRRPAAPVNAPHRPGDGAGGARPPR